MKIVYAEKRNAETTLMFARHKYENERICAKQNKTKQTNNNNKKNNFKIGKQFVVLVLSYVVHNRYVLFQSR